MNDDFWSFIEQLVAEHEIVIDRLKDSPHPRWPDIIYPLDYGYLEGTTAGDGDGIDVWIGSSSVRSVDAITCTVDLFKKDMEVKILLGCNDGDISTIERFLNSTESLRCVVLKRNAK